MPVMSSAQQEILGLVNFSRQIVVTAPIGMNLLHQFAVCGYDLFFGGIGLNTQYRQRLLAADIAAAVTRVGLVLPAKGCLPGKA